MQTGAAVLQNNIEVTKKVKNRTTIQTRNCTNIYSKDTNLVIQGGTCMPILIAEISTVAKRWKNPGVPLTDDWIICN